MSGRKIIEGLRAALEFAKCEHEFVESSLHGSKRRGLYCTKCKAIVYPAPALSPHEDR